MTDYDEDGAHHADGDGDVPSPTMRGMHKMMKDAVNGVGLTDEERENRNITLTAYRAALQL